MVEVKETKKRGRPATKEVEAVVCSVPEKVKIQEGLVSKSGLWKVVGKRGDLWIIAPTEKHTKAFGKVPMTEEQLKELFEV